MHSGLNCKIRGLYSQEHKDLWIFRGFGKNPTRTCVLIEMAWGQILGRWLAPIPRSHSPESDCDLGSHLPPSSGYCYYYYCYYYYY